MMQKTSPLPPLPPTFFLKFILWIFSVLALASSFSPELSLRLSLTAQGIDSWELWRLLSYPTALSAPSFSLLFPFAFTLYLTWLFGTLLLQRMGPLPLALLYLGSTLFAGGAAFFALLPSPIPFSTPLPPLLSLLFSWSLFYPEEQLLLFGLIKAKGRWVIAGGFASLFFFALSNKEWPLVASYSASLLFSYLFTLAMRKKESYLSLLRPFERAFLSCLRSFEGEKRIATSAKIYDIRSGKPLASQEDFQENKKR